MHTHKLHTSVLEKSSLFLIILDSKGNIQHINTHAEKHFYASKENIIGESIFNFVLDNCKANLQEILNTVKTTEAIHHQYIKFCTTTEDGVLTLKLDFTQENDVIYAIGTETTKQEKEHQVFMAVSEFGDIATWYYNPKTSELYWSNECYNMHGIDPNDPDREHKRQNSYQEKNRDRVREHIATLISTKKSFDFVEVNEKEDAEIHYFRIMAEPLIHNDEVIFVNGIVVDVTEMQTYVEQLKHSEETKKLALKGIRSGLFDHIITTNMVYYSPSFRKMLGLSLTEDFVPEEEFRKMIHPDDVEEAYTRHLNNLQQEDPHYFNHYRLRHIDGKYRFYEVYGYSKKDTDGKVSRMIGNLIDVDERKINEQLILKNQRRLQAMVNNGFLFTFLLNKKGEVLLTDEASVAIIEKDFNVNPNKTNCRFIDVLPLNFKHTFAYSFNEALKGNMTRKELERVTTEGNSQWLEIQYSPIFDQQQNVTSVLIGLLDVTERKMAELAIKEAHIKEQELNSLKTNILANFSHEIRTPLNGIMAISNLLITEKDEDEREKLLHYLNESKERLLETINNLSNFSEIEAIKANIDLKVCDLNYTVESSYREFDHLAEGKQLNYKLILDESQPNVEIDEELFRTAFNNIIHNAIKYTHTGNITIHIYTDDTNETAFVSVKDTGIGIEEENLTKIFDPFVQESIGLSRKYEGTGIGLSVSKRYIEILDGSITVTSEVVKGSEFIITLPICS
ncbi:PAS domain S-box protein [uncultured Kordia sp.]|uniref:PAS domain S-box protein n=1 Tax=uncultured Kordia sp. TaxID=507699 RepID=UPI00261E20E5|nr:PAS domain S-box protein [uncultured Kordia sp.]